MKRKTITIKNVDQDVIEMLADLRLTERRQLAAILEDCVNAYVCGDCEDEGDEVLTSAG